MNETRKHEAPLPVRGRGPASAANEAERARRRIETAEKDLEHARRQLERAKRLAEELPEDPLGRIGADGGADGD